jgi:hypothetical protein
MKSQCPVDDKSFIFAAIHIDYFWIGLGADAGVGAADADVGTSETSTRFTDSGISFACATNWLTCQSCVSLSLDLNAGMPDSRMPFATFQ